MAPSVRADAAPKDRGLAYGLAAYAMWGLFPLYFRRLEGVGPVEIIAHRVLWSLIAAVILVVVLRRMDELETVLRQPRTVLVLAAAGVLIALNWLIWVWGVNAGHTLDAALGYFINPLFSAFLGVLLLRERLRTMQWVAFGIGTAAVIVLIVGYGAVPFVALGLATTFGVYGLLKKQVGGNVTPLAGLVVETAAVAPIVIVYLISIGGTRPLPGATTPWLLLAIAGPVTLAPLLAFAAAARRLPLSTVAMLQYIAPIGQFIIGWLVFQEQMPAARWAGFGLIWLALVIFAVDGLRQRARKPVPN